MRMSEQYKNAILAPMVRIGTLPFRLLCIEEGAALVYSEEIIDHRLMNCQQFNRDKLVEWRLTADDNPVFQTSKKESDKVILQLGTSDPERAVKAAKLVEDHVAGIDVNMGCPKDYSTKGGMGAALLRNPENAEAILKALVTNINKPISAKIRCLSSIEETVEFARRMEATGISALAIHGRRKTERPRNPCRDDFIAAVADALDIPVIANGGSNDIVSLDSIMTFMKNTKTAGVLVARAAMWNPSVFSKNGRRDIFSIIPRYCELCLEFDFAYEVMKYTILQMLRDLQEKDPRGLKTRSALCSAEIAEAWDVSTLNIVPPAKKPRIDHELAPYPYYHNVYRKLNMWPKQALEIFIRAHFGKNVRPNFELRRRDKDGRFTATMTLTLETKIQEFIGGYESNKRQAEQAAALQAVVLFQLMTPDECGLEDVIVLNKTWQDIIAKWECVA